MGGLEGYKGIDGIKEVSGLQDIPQSFDSKKNESILLNNKINETIDTFQEGLGKILSEQELEKFVELLLESSKNSQNPKIFVDKVNIYVKSCGNDILKTDLQDIIGMVLEEEMTSKKEEMTSKKEEMTSKKEEMTSKKEEMTSKKEEMTSKKEEMTSKKEEMTSKKEEMTSKKEEMTSKKEEMTSKKEEMTSKKEEVKLEKNSELKIQKGNLNNLNNSLKGLSTDNVHYGDIIKKVNELVNGDFDKVKYEEIINLLKDDNVLLYILDDLKEKNTEQYSSFRTTLINMNQGFENKLDLYDTGLLPAQQKIAFGSNNLNGTNISSQVLRQKTNDGFNVEVGKNGRKLSMEGSVYQLRSKIDVRGDIMEVREIEKEMKEKVSPLNNILNSIQSIKKYVNESVVNGVEVDDIKQNIKNTNPDLYNELQLDLVTSIEQIIQGLDYLYNKTEKEKDKILKKIKQKIDEIVSKNTNEANKKDEEKKKTLKYLNQICFDLFPQSLTNLLIKEYKSNSFSIPGINLNKGTLDLENGMFGETFMERGGDRMKDNLVMFMEKAIYGELGHKNSIFQNPNFKNGATIVPSDFMGVIKSQGILKNGTWNIIKLRENLSKEVIINKKVQQIKT